MINMFLDLSPLGVLVVNMTLVSREIQVLLIINVVIIYWFMIVFNQGLTKVLLILPSFKKTLTAPQGL